MENPISPMSNIFIINNIMNSNVKVSFFDGFINYLRTNVNVFCIEVILIFIFIRIYKYINELNNRINEQNKIIDDKERVINISIETFIFVYTNHTYRCDCDLCSNFYNHILELLENS